MDLLPEFSVFAEHVAYICKTLKLPDHESQRVAEDLKDLIRKKPAACRRRLLRSNPAKSS